MKGLHVEVKAVGPLHVCKTGICAYCLRPKRKCTVPRIYDPSGRSEDVSAHTCFFLVTAIGSRPKSGQRPRSTTAIHSMAVDRTLNLPNRKRTFNH